MTQNQFLKIMSGILKELPESEQRDILYDYEEHFAIGLKEGKTEEEISRELGDPKAIARIYHAEYRVKQAESNRSMGNLFRTVVAVLSLSFFNMFFFLVPLCGLLTIMLGLFAAAVGVIVSGLALIFGLIFVYLPIINFPITVMARPFFGIGFFVFGLLVLLGDYYLGRQLYNVVVRYLKTNINIIKVR